MNFTAPEASMNSTNVSFFIVDRMSIVLYSISLLFGLPTHSYVIWLIVTGTESGVASEFLDLNFSICEIVTCLYSLLSIFQSWNPYINTLVCFLLGLGVTGRPLFQLLICVERYLAVVHPVTFLKYKPLRYKVICCAVVWIITLGSCMCCMYTIISHYTVYLWLFSTQFLLFLSIQLFCCLAVLRALKQSGPGERGRKREEENNMKRRAFHLILITTVTMIAIYAPFSMSGFIVIFSQQFIKELFYFGFIFFALAGFVQPFLYLHRVGKLFCLFFV